MGYSSDVYTEASNRMFQRRLQAEKSADFRKEEFFKKVPKAKLLEQEISTAGIQAARAVVQGGNVAEQLAQLRDRNLDLQKQLNELLASYNLTADYFEPKYRCKKCNDRGSFEENGKTVMCQCMKSLLIQCACEELNKTAPLALSKFENFNLDYYSKNVDEKFGISPYSLMEKILKYCKKYAAKCSGNSGSILMRGATGLGKTHLSLAIANEVIKKGYGVIYVSAPQLIQRLEKDYFSHEKSDDSIIEMLYDCDLLIVDDLGTEFKTQFSMAQLYNIFNSRMLANKPMIISTNLTLSELEKNYSERFVSRIIGNAEKLDFIGNDIRALKRKF